MLLPDLMLLAVFLIHTSGSYASTLNYTAASTFQTSHSLSSSI